MLRGSINHVSITVRDLGEAMKFFKPFLEILGYQIGQVIQDPKPAAEKAYTEAMRALERGTPR